MKKYSMDVPTLVRTILLLAALVNGGLVMFGYEAIPIDEQGVYDFISLAFLAGTSIWSWWKNNNVTPEAKIAQKKLKQVKAKKEFIKQSGSPMPLDDVEIEERNYTGGTL